MRIVCILGSEENSWTVVQKSKAQDYIRYVMYHCSTNKQPVLNIDLSDLPVLSDRFREDKQDGFLQPVQFISSDNPWGGIGQWVSRIAGELDLDYRGYPSDMKQWDDLVITSEDSSDISPDNSVLKGFKSKNIEMASIATDLVVIEPSMTVEEYESTNHIYGDREKQRWVMHKTMGVYFRMSSAFFAAKQFEIIHKKYAKRIIVV